MTTTEAAQFSRYAALLTAAASESLRGADLPGVCSAAAVLLGGTSQDSVLVEGFRALARSGGRVADEGGAVRPVYYPLAVHLNLAAFAQRYESMSVQHWGVCEELIPRLIAPLRRSEEFSDAQAVAPPELTDLALWDALCILEQSRLLARDVDAEWIDALVQAVANRPGPGGSLHPMNERESLDAWTYRELCALHAMANLALARRNSLWSRRVEEAATYHMEHTQPDHVTTQPWAVFAFLWSPRTRSFGEQQLHDAAAHAGGVIGRFSAALLADAAAALRSFGSPA